MNIWQRTVEEQDAEIARAKAEMKERCAQVADQWRTHEGIKIAAEIRALENNVR